jgi:excisionase family DNA binding protein
MNKNQNSDKRKTYSLWPEAGEMLGLAKNATYNAAHRGEIPIIKIGGRILVPKAAFDRMFEATK